jgi:hypothetical protein
LRAKTGDLLYLLTTRGEGFHAVWYRGRFFHSVDLSFLGGSECEAHARKGILSRRSREAGAFDLGAPLQDGAADRGRVPRDLGPAWRWRRNRRDSRGGASTRES